MSSTIAARPGVADAPSRPARVDAPAPPLTPAQPAPPPSPLTRFIGRESAVVEIERLLQATRLLTVTGAGGSGKTRLTLEVARRAAAAAPHGVAWVELAELASPELVPPHVAASLGLREEGGRSAFDALLLQLQSRPLLLVLDNCEHVVEACAVLVEALLRAAPALRILATSREPLGVPGERAWLIPALTLPDRADDVAASEAVQLFVERARDAHPAFELTPANSAAVGQICRRLEGMPLAIVLAAARVRVLPPAELALRLDDAFRALGSAGRGALPRHRTLRAVMDWSYALLSEPERTLLHRLSVFGGTFALDAAESVCADDPAALRTLPAGVVLDVLAALVDRSLVVMRERDGRARYRLLDTVRQYAAERLREFGEEAALRRRHAAYYVALAAEVEPELTTVRRRAHFERLQRNADNIRQALAWTQAHEPAEHVRLAGMLCWYWFSTREWVEGRRWLEGALALPAAAAPTRARAAALFGAGVFASLQADPGAAVPWLEESAALAGQVGDARLEAYARNYLGMALVQSGRPEGRAPVEQAMTWFRAADDLYGLRLSYLLLSTLALAERRIERAHELAGEAVRIARLFGANRELGIALQTLAGVKMVMGDAAGAGVLARESLEAMRHDPMYLFIARGLDLLGAICLAQRDAHNAARMCAAAAAIRAMIGAQPFQFERDRIDAVLAGVRAALDAAAFEGAWQEGSAFDVDAAIDAALALPLPAPAEAPIAGAEPALAERMAAAPVAGSTGQPDTAARIEVRALGRLEITRVAGAAEPIVIPHARPRELLVHLLCHPEGRTREQIGLVFWPDASAAQVKNSFHVALHHLRRSMGRADFIVFEQERYRVNPDIEVWFDVAHFERTLPVLLRRARAGDAPVPELRAVLALYEGHFLAGTEAGDWHLEVHDVLQRLCIDGLTALGGLLMAREEWAEAIAVYERLLRLDDLNEAACRQLMRGLARNGERARALRQYERMTTLLREELDAEPEDATARAAEEIRAGTG